jgi:hypothetical protein
MIRIGREGRIEMRGDGGDDQKRGGGLEMPLMVSVEMHYSRLYAPALPAKTACQRSRPRSRSSPAKVPGTELPPSASRAIAC